MCRAELKKQTKQPFNDWKISFYAKSWELHFKCNVAKDSPQNHHKNEYTLFTVFWPSTSRQINWREGKKKCFHLSIKNVFDGLNFHVSNPGKKNFVSCVKQSEHFQSWTHFFTLFHT